MNMFRNTVTANYEHGCIYAPVPDELRRILLKDIAPTIDEGDLYPQEETMNGVETDTHITVLYGINPDKACKDTIKEYFTEPIKIKSSGKVDYFDNDNTVAIVPVESEQLTKLHNTLKEELPNKDSHPEYKPHITIAYMQPGVRLKDEEVEPFEWEITKLILSNPDGTTEDLYLEGYEPEKESVEVIEDVADSDKESNNLSEDGTVYGDPIVFLGGETTDWRDDIVEEFKDTMILIDPVDEDWEAEVNIYDEVANMLLSDEVVFYKGGEGTEHEKELLDRLEKPYKEFDDLGDLEDYLETVASVLKTSKNRSSVVYSDNSDISSIQNYISDYLYDTDNVKLIISDMLGKDANNVVVEGLLAATESDTFGQILDDVFYNTDFTNIDKDNLDDEANIILRNSLEEFFNGIRLPEDFYSANEFEIWRAIKVRDVESFIDDIKRGVSKNKESDGLGLYWSYNKEGARPYHSLSDPGETIILHGIVGKEYVDIYGTISAAAEFQGRDEYELRVLSGSPIKLLDITLGDGTVIPIKNTLTASITDSPEFKAWFGDSKVVDEDGNPLVVYHGTHESFSEFKPSFKSGVDSEPTQQQLFFTPNPEFAGGYAYAKGANIYPVYLKVEKLFDKVDEDSNELVSFRNYLINNYDFSEDDAYNFSDAIAIGNYDARESKQFVSWLQENGYDGYTVKEAPGQSTWGYAVFSPNQIKSAIGNTGKFDPEDADIRASLNTIKKAFDQDGYAYNTPSGIFNDVRDKFLGNLGDNYDYYDPDSYKGFYNTSPLMVKRLQDMMNIGPGEINESPEGDTLSEKSDEADDYGSVPVSDELDGKGYDDYVTKVINSLKDVL